MQFQVHKGSLKQKVFTWNKVMETVGSEPDPAVGDEDEGDGGAVAPLLPHQPLQPLHHR